jgi:putative transposase
LGSFGSKEYGNGFKLDGWRLRVSGIGRLRVRWQRPVEGSIQTLRIRRQAGEWYACFACEVGGQPLEPAGGEIGIDVGLVHLLARGENEVIDKARWYPEEQKKLRVIQRQVSRRREGGANWRRSVLALERHHEHIANRRKDDLNKLANYFASHYDRIAIENLQISGMVPKPHRSKSILDAGWGYLKQRLIEEAAEAGSQVYPVKPGGTSQTCCACGRTFPEISPAVRWVDCRCGVSMDRDVNAAVRILKRAVQGRSGASQTAV